MSSPTKPSNAVLQQAAQWYAVLRDNQASEQRAQWRQWLNADEAHRNAWREVEAICRQFEPLRHTADPKHTAGALQEANAQLQRRRRVLNGLVCVAGTGLLGWLSWHYTPLPSALLALRADYSTATGAQRDILLADGSRIWLNTASAVDVRFDTGLRRISLLAGEIFIDTMADAGRPFVVDTGQGRLQALGTRFNVLKKDSDIQLAVYQGAVAIDIGAKQQRLQQQHLQQHLQQRKIISAGQQVRFTTHSIGRPEPADSAREAWTRGILMAEDISLGELVDQLRRYRQGHIGLADEIAALKVYGNFPLHDTDKVLSMLATALPVKVNPILPWWVNIEPE